LPTNADAESLAEYAARQHAELVLLSTEDHDLISALRDRAVEDEPDDDRGGINVEAVPPG
jgi:hypothetical protein